MPGRDQAKGPDLKTYRMFRRQAPHRHGHHGLSPRLRSVSPLSFILSVPLPAAVLCIVTRVSSSTKSTPARQDSKGDSFMYPQLKAGTKFICSDCLKSSFRRTSHWHSGRIFAFRAVSHFSFVPYATRLLVTHQCINCLLLRLFLLTFLPGARRRIRPAQLLFVFFSAAHPLSMART